MAAGYRELLWDRRASDKCAIKNGERRSRWKTSGRISIGCGEVIKRRDGARALEKDTERQLGWHAALGTETRAAKAASAGEMIKRVVRDNKRRGCESTEPGIDVAE